MGFTPGQAELEEVTWRGIPEVSSSDGPSLPPTSGSRMNILQPHTSCQGLSVHNPSPHGKVFLLCFPQEDTEVQRGEAFCPKLHCQEVGESILALRNWISELGLSKDRCLFMK